MKLKYIISALAITTIIFTGCSSNNENIKVDKSQTADNKNTKASEQGSSENTDLAEYEKQFSKPEVGDTIAVIKVKGYGDIKVKFFKDVAPKAVENFVTHSEKGYYNGLTFHRVIEDFMIQGGDPKGTGTGGESIWGKPFEDEFPKVMPIPYPYNGALAMANAGPNTNGSQFFIVDSPYNEQIVQQMKNNNYYQQVIELYKKHGGTPHLFGKHTVFGQVYEGMDVVDKISKAPKKEDSREVPNDKIIIEKILIEKYK